MQTLVVPNDFAILTGINQKGKTVALGKQFLTDSDIRVNWAGKRDVDPQSPGNQIFLAYLKEKGRDDLINAYFTS